MNPFLRSKINLYYFICMVALLLVHNYNYAPFIITPSTRATIPFSLTNFVELLFSNSLLRFRMGLLMAISGYLMANSKMIPYTDLIIKKTKSLLIPYVIVSIIGLIITFILETAIFGWHNTGSSAMIGKSIWNFTVKDFVTYLFVTPVSFQLWYLKTIFMMAMLSPVIRLVLQKFPLPALAFVFVIWLFTNYLDGETRDRAFIFYGFGYYLRLYNKDILQPVKGLNPYLALVIFISISLFRATMAFYTPSYSDYLKYILTITYKLNEIFSLYAIWFCLPNAIKAILNNTFYQKYCGCSFFLYAFHAPFINYVSQWLRWKGAYEIQGSHGVLYILLPAFVLILIMALNRLAKQYLPRVFLLVSGGRTEEIRSTGINLKVAL